MGQSSKFIEKRFESESTYYDKHFKSKIKSYEGKINAYFHDIKVPNEGSQCTCLSVSLIDSVFRTGKTIILKCF